MAATVFLPAIANVADDKADEQSEVLQRVNAWLNSGSEQSGATATDASSYTGTLCSDHSSSNTRVDDDNDDDVSMTSLDDDDDDDEQEAGDDNNNHWASPSSPPPPPTSLWACHGQIPPPLPLNSTPNHESKICLLAARTESSLATMIALASATRLSPAVAGWRSTAERNDFVRRLGTAVGELRAVASSMLCLEAQRGYEEWLRREYSEGYREEEKRALRQIVSAVRVVEGSLGVEAVEPSWWEVEGGGDGVGGGGGDGEEWARL